MKVIAYLPTDSAIIPTMEDGNIKYTITLVCPKMSSSDFKTLLSCLENSNFGEIPLIIEQGK